MPHQHRRTKKTKKPKRTQPLGLSDPEALKLHRELSVLRIAGRAKPGQHRDELLKRRFAKLDASERQVPTPKPVQDGPVSEAQAIALREYYERKRK